jgi:hypothetical protein
MFKKTFLFSVVTVLVAMMYAPTASAIGDSAYNRPNPLMNYVPQERGMYDTRYDHLTESDCRDCHGQSVMDRHHYTDIVLQDNLCTPCHDVIQEPPGLTVIRNCTTSGCHSWDDVGVMDNSGTPPNGWHHNTDLSSPENCVICHNPNLVAPITIVYRFDEFPPLVVTPTPFSCEDCHWAQAVVQASPDFDPITNPPSDAGHPSTYHHGEAEICVDQCYHEYGIEILANWDTHHMGIKAPFSAECLKCHTDDINEPDWDYTNPELIRYCEKCHDVNTLHTIFEHVGPVGGVGSDPAVNGWQAVGFHAPGTGDPVDYRPFEANEMCFGCHGDVVPWVPGERLRIPAININPQGINPTSGTEGYLVELTGEAFGDKYGEGKAVQLKQRVDGAVWINMPISSWADDTIVFEIPCRTFNPGNYRVRVYNEGSSPLNHYSNQVGFTIKDG